ncbi:efflux RND transporter periplasmic adaptor subunit [Cyclobacterium amurskyense]|uniref:Putative Co/Zn/Cd efflux system membrane fusion protein n=1 Tax=Cyclobacterium amurskyense TaxID=320787 RepID=A0A0H4PI12_9BACT|nr:efflux RND transporter periplasmic adaptor subunit [Cyclobacterium amurskyense]AKP52493.1 Putative Co/Zn/Cd efflux system membrane fusion protein [Cyclobacterium amurskyense]
MLNKNQWFRSSFLEYRTVITMLYLAGIVFTTVSCSEGNGKNKKNAEILEVPVFTLSPKSIEVPQTYVCDLQAIQFVEVRSKVEGFVEKIYVDEGQSVKKGQPLFQLSSAEYNELVNSAKAKLMQAKAEEKSATLEVERLKVLVDKKIYSQSELELAQSKKDMAQSSILEAESMLKNAQVGLSYTTVKAPFDGIVDRIPYKTGSLVKSGDLLTNITDISEIFAYYRITENEYLEFMRGELDKGSDNEQMNQQVKETLQKEQEEISLIMSDGVVYPYKGKLETMEADFEQGTGSIALRVRFPNPDQLIKHGASGKVQMKSMLNDVFLIPQKSTFEIQEYNYVYLVDSENKVNVRSFRPMGRHGLFYIAQDFKPNDKVVLEGIQLLKDDVTVKTNPVGEDEIYKSLDLNL